MANDEHSPPPQPQWKALTGLIGGTKVSDDPLNGQFDTRLWIIDTGASRHVTGDSTWMTNAKDIFHCHVGLPNGEIVVATQEGSVRLTDKITLNQVLYVPSLSCNLISVSQLNDDMQSSVHFNSYMCAIQDQSREMIGTGVRRDGLYYFKGTDSVQHLTVNGVTTSFDLWHQRMGHPSEKVMKLLPSVGTAARSFNKACEVCFHAKQPREKFPLSNNRASRIFENIHCDLWGPYRHQSSCGARYFLTIIDDYSRAVWVNLLIDKTEILKMFLSFVAMIDRQFSQSIKVVQSDNDMTTIPHEEFVHEDFSVIIEEAEPSSTNEPSPQPEPSSTPEPTSQPESNLTPEFTSQTERHTSNRCAIDDDKPSLIGSGSKKETAESESKETGNPSEEVSKPAVSQEEASKPRKARPPPVFDLGKRLSCKWSSGVGARIGCVRDYPLDLQSQALEKVNLSPRVNGVPHQTKDYYNLPIPSPRPRDHFLVDLFLLSTDVVLSSVDTATAVIPSRPFLHRSEETISSSISSVSVDVVLSSVDAATAAIPSRPFLHRSEEIISSSISSVSQPTPSFPPSTPRPPPFRLDLPQNLSGASDSGLHLECSTPSASLPLLFWVFPATSSPCSRTRVGSPPLHAPHTEHHDDADNTIQEIKRKHHHDVQCGGHVRGGDLTRVCEHGDDVAGNTQNSNDGEANGVEHSK
nr:Retrovirus-related Pol polyprotein from transposon TNT 1-94 [Ipomoea batatas]